MLKKFFVLAGLATLSNLSVAQSSVNLYGIVDLGVAHTSNGAPAGGDALLVNSGIAQPSLFGLRGTEDLGGGLQAVFRLEAGFDADTGSAKTYFGTPSTATPAARFGGTSSGLFNRRAHVGLNSELGSLIVGRDYTPLYWAALDIDLLRLGMFGNLQQVLAISSLPNSINPGSDLLGRTSNGIYYKSPTMAGFTGRAMYSLGSESPGGAGTAPSNANRLFGLSGNYTQGGLMLIAVYQSLAVPLTAGAGATLAFTGATEARKDFSLGLKYTLGDYGLSTGYQKIKMPNVANTTTAVNVDGSQLWLSGSAKLGDGTAILSLQRLRQNTGPQPVREGRVIGLAYNYPLSKRTFLYATMGQISNSALSAMPLVSGDGAIAPGALHTKIRAQAFGISHSF